MAVMSMLEQRYRLIGGLLEEIDCADEVDKGALVETLADELAVQMELESAYLRAVISDQPSLVETLNEAHREIRSCFRSVLGKLTSITQLARCLARVERVVARHVSWQRGVLLPNLKLHSNPARLEEMEARMRELQGALQSGLSPRLRLMQ